MIMGVRTTIRRAVIFGARGCWGTPYAGWSVWEW